jgi:adenosine kinase
MDILLAGSIAFDYLMRFPGKFTDMLIEQSLDKVSLSFLVEEMHRHHGGIAANVAYTLGLLGARPRLFGTVGKDFGDYRQQLEAVGVDTSTVVVIEDVFTGSFFANTDLDNNQIASFYSGAMQYSRDYRIMEVAGRKPDLVVISPTDAQAMANYIDECQAEEIRYVFDPSQQVARLDGEVLRRGIEGCFVLACNEYEWEVIRKKTALSLVDLEKCGVVFTHTLGADGVNIYHDGKITHIPAVKPRQIVDPTGAGDAFRAGLLRGISLNLPWEIAGRMGALCGTYALEHMGTQNHVFSIAQFVERYEVAFGREAALAPLMESVS